LPHLIGVPAWVRAASLVVAIGFGIGVAAAVMLRPAGEPVEGPADAPGIRGLVRRVRCGMIAARNPRALLVSIGLSLVAWGLEVFVVVAALEAVGLRLPLPGSLLVLLAVNLALAFPIAPPGNLGTLEAGAVLSLVALGVSKEQALVFALSYHFLQILPLDALALALAGGRELMQTPRNPLEDQGMGLR
jgi:uncharacterized membrane protein YbhN (UPF0104 family)